jgi:hypothetical protein
MAEAIALGASVIAIIQIAESSGCADSTSKQCMMLYQIFE